jgi:hypothetical protein
MRCPAATALIVVKRCSSAEIAEDYQRRELAMPCDSEEQRPRETTACPTR